MARKEYNWEGLLEVGGALAICTFSWNRGVVEKVQPTTNRDWASREDSKDYKDEKTRYANNYTTQRMPITVFVLEFPDDEGGE